MYIKVHPIPIFRDNYVWVIHNSENHEAYVVDPGDADPVLEYLSTEKFVLCGIIVTHSHWDHVSGIEKIIKKYRVPVYGNKSINLVTSSVKNGDIFDLWQGISANVIETPGHLSDHLSYFIDDKKTKSLFCGDTLFSSGCGRIFDGDHLTLKTSIDTLSKLPASTSVYCTHEYTMSNLEFAHRLEPSNKHILERIDQVKKLRQQNLPSLPSTIELEHQVNPFLRRHSPELQTHLKEKCNCDLSDDLSIFTELRRWKDSF